MTSEIPEDLSRFEMFFRTWREVGEVRYFEHAVLLWTVRTPWLPHIGNVAYIRQLRARLHLEHKEMRALEKSSVLFDDSSLLEMREGTAPITELRERMNQLTELPFKLAAPVPTFESKRLRDPTFDWRWIKGFGFEMKQGPMLVTLIWPFGTEGPNSEVQNWVRDLQDFLTRCCGSEPEAPQRVDWGEFGGIV